MSNNFPVIRAFRDKNTKKHYAVGSSFSSEDPDRISFLQEKRFIGVVVPIELKDQDPPKEEDGIKHVGGGYYELPNGEKIKGKDKALEELKKLNENPLND